MIRAGARRVLVVLIVLAGGSAALGIVLGLSAGISAARAAALGCYLVGAAAGFVGFILGSRRFFRRDVLPGDTSSPDPAASARDSRALAALLMLSGVALVLIGAAFDPGATVV
jgi:hypothetical protein